MWRDTHSERLMRYRACLQQNRDVCEVPECSQEQFDTFESVCTCVLAPSLDGFVLWVLKQALDSGKQRLYFLARDGYLMYRAADAYCRHFHLPIECRYLSCSRYSVRIPMYHLDMEEAMDYICRGGIDVTMRKILNRSGLNQQEQQEILDDIPMSSQPDEIIPYAMLSEIRTKLEKSALFHRYVTEHSKAAMPLLTGYLRQEGLADEIPYALVDSGWVGSMQKVLARAVSHIKNTDKAVRLEGYYWGLYELPDGVKAADYHCYYFSPADQLEEKIYFSNCLFEGVFSAPHGMTLGYRRQDGNYQPVYAEVSPEHERYMMDIEIQIQKYMDRGIIRREGQLDESGKCRDFQDYLRQVDFQQFHQMTYKLLRTFMGAPTIHEAELFGQLQFSDDVLEDGAQEIAAPLSQEALRDNHVGNKILKMLGIKKGHVRESAWYEGSAVRGGQDVQKHLNRYAQYKRLLYLRKKRVWSKRKDGKE